MTRVPGAMTSLYNYKLFNEIQLSLNSNSLWMWNWPPVVLNRISFNKPARGSLDICSLDGWNIPYDYKQKGLSIPCCLEFKVQWPHFTGWSTKHILCANVNFAPSFWIVYLVMSQRAWQANLQMRYLHRKLKNDNRWSDFRAWKKQGIIVQEIRFVVNVGQIKGLNSAISRH